MAKERDKSLPPPTLEGNVSRSRGKRKKRSKEALKRPTFRTKGVNLNKPNLNTTSSRDLIRRNQDMASKLRRNNEDLAKEISKVKLANAQLQKEKLTLEEELLDQKVKANNQVENEVQRRVSVVLAQIKVQFGGAMEHLCSLSNNLTEGIKLCSLNTKSSAQVQRQLRSSSIGGNYGHLRRVEVTNGQQRAAAGSGAEQPRQLSKVSPMVAGHAISRPRIQLTRMDMSAARIQLNTEAEAGQGDGEPEEEFASTETEVEQEAATEVQEGAEAGSEEGERSPHPGISRFDLTNIGEESSFLDESHIVQSPIEEEEGLSPSLDSLREEGQDEEFHTPAELPVLHSQQQQLLTPVAAPVSTTPGIEFPTSPSESFLEGLVDGNPLEGPSWLFASVEKKRRTSRAAKKLSKILSEDGAGGSDSDSRGYSPEESCLSEENSPGLETGFILDRDLLEPEAAGHEVGRGSSLTSRTSTDILDMELTRTENGENVNDSSLDESNLSISVNTSASRAPLASLTITDPTGDTTVRYNPRTDTGIKVKALKQSRILLNKKDSYKLSECYVDVSPGRSLSLEQVFRLGLEVGSGSPRLGTNNISAGKRAHVSDTQLYLTSSTKYTKGKTSFERKSRTSTSSQPSETIRTPNRPSLPLPLPRFSQKRKNTELEKDEEVVKLKSASSSLSELTLPVPRLKKARQAPLEEELLQVKSQLPTLPLPRLKKSKIALTNAKNGSEDEEIGREAVAAKKEEVEDVEETGVEAVKQATVGMSCGQEEQEGGRRRRASRTQAVSYKEPSGKSKMRQGDAGTHSVYKDFNPEMKSKKSKKKKSEN